MAVEIRSQAQPQGDQDHWDQHRSQDGVRDQDGGVGQPPPSLATKMNRPNMGVIVEIAAQEQRRSQERGDHRSAMLTHLCTLDEAMSNRQ